MATLTEIVDLGDEFISRAIRPSESRKIIFGLEIKANWKIILGRREYNYKGNIHLHKK